MKKCLAILFGALTFFTKAQAPQTINYQGMLRDQNGAPVTTVSTIGVKFDISDGSNNLVHTETQSPVAVNTLGLFSTKIGLSPAISNTITWQNGPYTLSVSIDAGAGFVFIGSQQLVSVPFALYAAKSGNSLPVGTKNSQTLRWNAVANAWAIDSNLTNDGAHVGIGLYPAGLQNRLHVTTNAINDTSAIFGYHANVPAKGAGIRGIAIGNTASNPNPYNGAIYGGNFASLNSGSGLSIGTHGIGISNAGTAIGLSGIGYAAAPTATATGLLASAIGAPGSTRFAAVFDQGNVLFNDSIFIGGSSLVGASPGNVLTLSTSGRAKWAPVPGGISSIATIGPILGGPITNTGTISLAPSGVSAGTYGTPGNWPFVTVDTYGRITSAGTFPAATGVTTINTAAPLSGGPITTSGTISLLPSGVVAGSYGAAPGIIPTFSVDTYGRIVTAGTYSITIPSSLSGNVVGPFASNTVTAIQNIPVSATSPTLGQVLMLLGGVWTPTTPPAIPLAAWIKNATTVTLATNSDNVGIGAANPVEKLQIENVGTTRMSVISTNTSAVWFGTTASHSLGFINYDVGSNEMNFGTGGTASRFRLFGNGTAAYGSTLAANPIGAHFNFCKQGANDTKVLISGGDNSNTYGGMLTFAENENSLQGMTIRLDAGGNRLWFTNDPNGTSPVMTIGGYSGANSGVAIGNGYAGSQAPVNGLAVQGFVGLGTTAPTTTLHVTGGMRYVDGTQGVNRVLTSDASGNATWKLNVGFKVEATASQVVSFGYNTIAYDNSIFDDAAAFNLATEQYVVPSTGLYYFNSTVYWQGYPATRPALQILVNGSLVHESFIYCASGSQLNQQVSTIVKVNTGDVVTTRVYNEGGNTNVSGVSGQQGTLFLGYKIY